MTKPEKVLLGTPSDTVPKRTGYPQSSQAQGAEKKHRTTQSRPAVLFIFITTVWHHACSVAPSSLKTQYRLIGQETAGVAATTATAATQ